MFLAGEKSLVVMLIASVVARISIADTVIEQPRHADVETSGVADLPEANALRNKSLFVNLRRFLLCNALQRFESASVAVVFDPNPSKPFDSRLTALC